MKLRTTLLATTLALSACGGSTDNSSSADSADVAASEVSAEPNVESEVSSDTVVAKEVLADSKPLVPQEYSSDDLEKIRRYGTCLSIMNTMIYGINKQGMSSDPSSKLAISTYAHQSAIYTIIVSTIINKYPEDLHESGLEISNDFLMNNIVKNNYSSSQMIDLKNENCPMSEFPSDEANSIMNNQADLYQKTVDGVKVHGL